MYAGKRLHVEGVIGEGAEGKSSILTFKMSLSL